MIVLNGKYGYAKVMLPKDKENILVHEAVDDADENEFKEVYTHLGLATQSQIESFLNHPAFAKRNIVIMPDTHYGKGSCVGFTMDLGDYVIPNIIGVDIGCGIMATNLGNVTLHEKDLHDLDEFIKSEVPAGFSVHKKPIEWYVDKIPLLDVTKYLDLDFEKVLNSIGTLGGGNHFIELGYDEDNYLWLTIHSGSRNLGLRIANHFQKIADDGCKIYFQDFGDLNFIPARRGGGDYSGYIDYMRTAQDYAHYNRLTMTRIIMEGFFGNVNYLEQIDSVHNYIDFEDSIIRKGATPAREGQKLVIPFNMEDGLIIATGKGNKDWNYSAPHGAGRIKSRNQAKKELDLNEAKLNMEKAGVYTTSLTEDSLDEAKGAYKDKDLILKMIEPTVEVNHFVKPVYNFKSSKKGE